MKKDVITLEKITYKNYVKAQRTSFLNNSQVFIVRTSYINIVFSR